MERHTDRSPALTTAAPSAPARPRATLQGVAAEPRPRAEGSGAFASPLPSMLELSAATRAVAAEPLLRPALAALQREARALTRSIDAAVVVFDPSARPSGGGSDRVARTIDGPITSTAFRDIVTRVAHRGRAEVFDHALVQPVGATPACAVIALWRPAGAPFEPYDVALVAALAGSVAATLQRLLGRRA